jgi:membrane-associated phospholipid phosphatase
MKLISQFQSIWDILSFLPLIVLYILYPLAIYTYYPQDNTYNNYFLIATIVLDILISLAKSITTWIPPHLTPWWIPRPNGACNCSLLNRGGAVGGQPGFPSGHSATVGMMLVGISLYARNKDTSPDGRYWKLITAGLSCIALGTLLARYYKQCHNLIQIITGFALGCAFAFGFHSYFFPLSHPSQKR